MYNTIILRIKGKNVNKFIERINHKKINIYYIEYIKYNEVKIEVSYKDYDTILRLKTIYEVSIDGYKGIKKINNNINSNKYLLISLLFGIILFTILINTIFDIEVVYSGNKLREYIYKELEKNGIKKYHLVKSFDEIEDIKKGILEDNKDILEWIEIERVGTKYIVKIEPRKINIIEEDNKIYNIVSNRSAIIKSIEANSGEVVKKINNYVNKGDIIISSNISLNDEVKKQVSAKGSVYGEVWYKVNIVYPLNYYEEKETGNESIYYNISIFNKDINLSKYKDYKKEDEIIIKNDILPIYISKQKQREIEKIDYKLDKESGINKAMEEGRKKINNNLNDKEYIIDEKCLKISYKDSKIVLDIFYTVYKDITEYIEIEG